MTYNRGCVERAHQQIQTDIFYAFRLVYVLLRRTHVYPEVQH